MKFCCNLPSLLSRSEPKALKPAPTTAFEPLPPPVVAIVLESFDSYDFGHSAEALASWLNVRWQKTGYEVSAGAVCFVLRSYGRDAKMGVPDHLDGAMVRPWRAETYEIQHDPEAMDSIAQWWVEGERAVIAKLLRRLDNKR